MRWSPKGREREYRAWLEARDRCFKPAKKRYADYGGRGITMCDEWRTNFATFYRDMGPKPSPSHSLDRINNDGHYEPGNCRWASHAEQQRNRRDNRWITYNGRTLVMRDWERLIGLGKDGLRQRLQRGWPIERALSEQPHKNHIHPHC